MRLLYYKHPALVKPSLPALKRSALSSPATSCGLLEKTPPTSKNSEPFLFKA